MLEKFIELRKKGEMWRGSRSNISLMFSIKEHLHLGTPGTLRLLYMTRMFELYYVGNLTRLIGIRRYWDSPNRLL